MIFGGQDCQINQYSSDTTTAMRSEKSAEGKDGLADGLTGSNLLGRLQLPIMTRQAPRHTYKTQGS